MARKASFLSAGALNAAIIAAGFAGQAHAQDVSGASSGDVGLEEIVVTAQKRQEVANKVGMSITAITGDKLVSQGVTSIDQLTKVVPGFQFTEASRGTPIYAIRGIGFDDSSLASNPTVALYTDEVPMAFPVESRFAALDLQRIEVLKGPQGTLFGMNSTAGAINFVTAKPTDSLQVGTDLSFSRFNTLDARGFISGPISDTLAVRLSGMVVHADGWQKSYTRDDSLGAKRQYAGRFLADWNPSDSLHVLININGWKDKSDTLAGQLVEVFPSIPAFIPQNYDSYPRAPHNSRAADWDPDANLARNDHFFQGSLRADYSINDDITLTSISALARYRQSFLQDVDATSIFNFRFENVGYIHSFNQEFRASGTFDSVKWIVGAAYSKDSTLDRTNYFFQETSVHYGFLGITNATSFTRQPIETYAGFSNVDWTLGKFVFHGGIRYTEDKRSSTGCEGDRGDGTFAAAYNIVLGLNGTPNQIQPGGCTTSDNGIPVLVKDQLNENNISWRLGVDYQAADTLLLYANVSRGYKSGAFPALASATAIQLMGVRQESVLAYEAGVKAGLFDRAAQINAAVFYNDYKDKQLRGRILDPLGVFGVLDALLNIPKSRVYGAEINVELAPTRGLNITLSGTYVNTKVTGDFFAYDPVGNLFNYKDQRFPHTPKWNFAASADYNFPLTSEWKGFVGGNMEYHSKTQSLFYRPELVNTVQTSPVLRPGVLVDARDFENKAYSTVDLRVGAESTDGKWKGWLWGRNVFNTYYWTNATQSLDTIYRLAAMPATYGVTVSLRFK